MRTRLLVAILTLVAGAEPAHAARLRVSYAIDGSLTGVAIVGGGLVTLIPVDLERVWLRQILPFDDLVKDNFSGDAAAMSDTLLMATFLTPLAAQLGLGFDEQLGKVTLVYAETLGANSLFTNTAKYLIQRPRPYTYHPSPAVERYEREEGRESRLSFYSGHASSAFAAAVAGSYLFGLTSRDTGARATLWGIELALATATANLRVRAGKHFYSDVIAGAAVGATLGWLIPFLHEGAPGYSPSIEEWSAMAGGLLAGALVSELVPMAGTLCSPLAPAGETACFDFVPMALENGAGLMLAGSL